MRLGSLILAAPGGSLAVAIDGPTSKLGYERDRLVQRFGELFKLEDRIVVCELKSKQLLAFNDVNRFANHGFGKGEIVRVHAVPDLAWQHVKKRNQSLEITDLLGPESRPAGLQPAQATISLERSRPLES